MSIQDVLLGFGISAVTLLAIPVFACAIGMLDASRTYREAAWQTGRPFMAVWAFGVVCLLLWAVIH